VANKPARRHPSLTYSWTGYVSQTSALGLTRLSAHALLRRRFWIVGNGIIGSIGEMEVNNEASVLPSNEGVSLDEVVNEREVLDSGIESRQMVRT
jgi:hypothetical protein